jgi:hypothetical protein
LSPVYCSIRDLTSETMNPFITHLVKRLGRRIGPSEGPIHTPDRTVQKDSNPWS